MSTVPDDLRFAPTHEWLQPDSGKVGISDHAQAELTDVVYVDLPRVGQTVAAGDTIAVVESVKAASDIYSPVGGEVVEVNEALSANPALLNTDPYGEGWMFRLRVEDEAGVEKLMDAESYRQQIAA